jgi:pimeloyl-ACP methyl ester carboxylesterase
MFKNFKEKHASLFEPKQSNNTSSATAGSDRGQDLTSILDRSQRADLTVLVAEIAESMRVALLEVFETPEPNPTTDEPSPRQSPSPEKDDEAPPLPARPQDGSSPASGEGATQREQRQRPSPGPGPRRNATAAAAKARAKQRTLSHFENWRDSVLLRIGEVVNRDDEPQEKGSSDAAKSDDLPLEEDEERIDKMRQVYHPIETPLLDLPKATRLLILHSLLLLLLSLKHYSAYSRVLLLYVSSSLEIDVKVLNENETKVARGLLDTVLALPQESDNKSEPKKKDNSRVWKVGIASVAGAALIGITGGLAAPLVAAGIGGIMGGLGLGATAAAGYLGALAGSSVLVGGLFGAYGGRMTGRMMDKYAREVEDFAFIPIRGARKQKTENESEAAQQDHRLRVTIGVTGWVKEEPDFVVPWRVVGTDSEVFALRWETKSLMNLGNAISALVTSAAWSVAGREILSRTFFAAIMSAVMLPLGLMKVARVVDNPFSVAKSRADKAGEILADALINKAQGERPVTLIGYSLGSRLIYSCLQSLCRRSAYGLVESVILMGSPTPSDGEAWRRIRSVVSGRVVNVFSENDSVLAFLYRTSSLQFGVAGLQPIEGVPGVENLDVSEKISGHLRYQYLLGSILTSIGLQDLNQSEIEREEAALADEDRKQEEERLRNEREAGVQDRDSPAAIEKLNSQEGFEEEGRMQKQIEAQTEEHMAHRIQMLDLEDDDYSTPLPDQSGKYSAI